MLEGNSRWLAYLIVVLLTALGIAGTKAKLLNTQQAIRRVPIFLVGISPFLIGSLLNRWTGKGHEGLSYLDDMINPISAQILVASLAMLFLVSASPNSRNSDSHQVQFLAVALVVIVAVFNSRIGDLIVTFRQQLPLFLLALPIFGYAIGRDLTFISCASANHQNSTFNQQRSTFVQWFLLMVPHAILSIRIDGLTVPGAWFHLGYFTGPIETVRSGGLLLWDTPSQYGFLNILLPTLIPGVSGQTAALMFQGVILFVVGAVVLTAIRSAAVGRNWMAIGATFLLLLHFADPALIGPQPFPSSSVMRFGPSLTLVALLSMIRANNQTRLRSVGVVVGLSLLWSFESAYYSSIALLGWTAGHLINAKRWSEFVKTVRTLLTAALATVSIVGGTYWVYVFLRVGDAPTWSWFYLAASQYAEGFGGLPTDVWGASWLLLLPIGLCTMLTWQAHHSLRSVCMTSAGALVGWLTYYVGRSHSSNIIAMLPLIFASTVIPCLMALNAGRDESLLDSREFPVRMAPESNPSTLDLMAKFLVVFSAILISAFVSNPALPNAVTKLRPFGTSQIFDVDPAVSESLAEVLGTLNPRNLSAIYVGNLGLLPALPKDLSRRLSTGDSWLPQPLGLLEEPIPREERLQMLRRYIERDPRDGYLIWHKSNSIPGRFEEWIADLAQTHDCKSVIENDDWQIRECTLRVR